MKPDDWDEEEDGEWEAPQIGESLIYMLLTCIYWASGTVLSVSNVFIRHKRLENSLFTWQNSPANVQ